MPDALLATIVCTTTATEMLCAFWVVTAKQVVFSEVYFDLKTGAQRPILRKE